VLIRIFAYLNLYWLFIQLRLSLIFVVRKQHTCFRWP